MYDKSFLHLVLSHDCAGSTALERIDFADDVAGQCLYAPEWIPAGSTKAPVSEYARHFSPAINRDE